MRKGKRIFCVILGVLCILQTVCVWGGEREWYSMHEVDYNEEAIDMGDGIPGIVPYARYIMGTTATIRRPSSSVIWMRSEVFCTETMSKITTTFTLQKKSGNSWINVGQESISVTNSNSMYKIMEVTGVSSGTYRCKTNTQVISKTGYSETASAVSGSV